MKIILHIGQSKTGTSAIQSFLFEKRSELASEGYLYPTPKHNNTEYLTTSHNALADSLSGAGRYPFLTADQYFESFYSEANRIGAHTLILSAEHFWGGEPRAFHAFEEEKYWHLYSEKVRMLKAWLIGHEVEIIIYLRPQLDWFISTYAYEICFLQASLLEVNWKDWFISDYCKTSAEFFEKNRPLLDYNKRLKVWNDIVQPNMITAVPFIKDQLKDGDIVSDFCSRIGLNKYSPPKMTVNKSVDGVFVEVKKTLNKKSKSLAMELTIIEVLRFLSDRYPSKSSDLVSSDMQKVVEDFCHSSNELLAANYGDSLLALNATRKVFTSPELTPIDYQQAMALYEQTISQPFYRLRVHRHEVANFLRHRLPALHALAAKIKRVAKLAY